MIEPLAEPGEIVDLALLEEGLQTPHTTRLVSTRNVQITWLVVPQGAKMPTHEPRGEIVLHCLEGRVAVTALAESHQLRAGQLLYLCVDEPFSIQGIEHASLILTVIMPMQGAAVELIGD